MRAKINNTKVPRWWTFAHGLGLRTTIQYFAQRGVRDILEFKIRGIRTPVYCRSQGPDFLVLHQLLGEKACDFPFRNPPSLIIDAGAHVGFATLFYANRWPGVRIIALEPEANNCNLLRMNCSNYPNITVIQGALWHERTRLQITNPNALSWGFRMGECSSPDLGSNLVEAYTVSDLLNISGQSRISLLKIDIEGAELNLFVNGPQRWLNQVDAILIELHERFRPGCRSALENAVQGRQVIRFHQGEYEGIQLAA